MITEKSYITQNSMATANSKQCISQAFGDFLFFYFSKSYKTLIINELAKNI